MDEADEAVQAAIKKYTLHFSMDEADEAVQAAIKKYSLTMVSSNVCTLWGGEYYDVTSGEKRRGQCSVLCRAQSFSHEYDMFKSSQIQVCVGIDFRLFVLWFWIQTLVIKQVFFQYFIS